MVLSVIRQYLPVRMWRHPRASLLGAALGLLLGAAPLFAQSAPPTMPDHTVYGRIGSGSGSGPGQAIPFTTLPSNLSVSQLYAAPTAQGNGNCFSAANACALPTACALRSSLATFATGPFAINLAAGTYSSVNSDNALCSIYGNNGGSSPTLTQLNSNGAASSVILAAPSLSGGVAGSGIIVKDGGEVQVFNVTITCGNSCTGINNQGQGAVSDYDNIIWGSWGTGGAHVSGTWGSYVNEGSDGDSITSNFGTHWSLSGNANLNAAGVTKITNSVSWSGIFLSAAGTGGINISGWSYTGSSLVGVRGNFAGFYVTTAANAPINSVLPGNQNASFLSGNQTSAGDPTALPKTTYANLVENGFPYVVGITDGNASNCGDGTCTTPGTTVTGGGGSLPLLIANNGSGWFLVEAFAVIAVADLRAEISSGFIYFKITGVNFNSATTDNAIPISLPTGMTRFLILASVISNASHTLVSATAGVFSSTGGGGVAICADQAITVSATTDATANNTQLLTCTNAENTSFVLASLAHTPNMYLRVGTAEGVAATADVTLQIRPLP